MKEGWTYKKLDEVGVTQTGTTPSKTNSANYGDFIPFIRPAEIPVDGSGKINYNTEIRLSEEGVKNGRLFKTNSVLMVCIGSIGKLGYLEQDASCNQQINVLTPNAEYDSKYVFYAMSTPAFQKESLKIAQGAQATLPIINKSKWSNLLIPIPPTIDEQHFIVSRLDAAFANIDALKANAERQLAEARKLFQAELTECMRPKEGWEEKTLKEIGLTQTGTTPSKTDPNNFGDYIPFIRPSEIDFDGCGNIDYDSEIKLSERGLKIGRLFKAHSILMVCIGATISKVGFCTQDVSCNQQINVITPKDEYDFKFIYYAMRNKDFRDKVIKDGTSAQATLPIINKGKWEKLTIYCPSIEIQRQIVARLDALSVHVRQLEEVQRKSLAECDALKQAMLREVFE